MAVALEQFVKNLEDSGILTPSKLQRFLPPSSMPKDAQDLARELVKQKQLTKFQVQEIYQGRAKSLIVGAYTIVDRIGAGGMGQVFKAEHRRMHRLVAIKMLPPSLMKDGAAVARFQREVEAAAKLEHPNIVTAYDADQAGDAHFLVMQFVEGSDLSALVKQDGPFPLAIAVNYVLQAARGLEFAHGEGVVHRDIKPANLLLDKRGTVKILDMGLARLDSGNVAAAQAELTTTGAVMGSIDYMAPEQALNTKHADQRADIYSLGCTLYYLAVGKPLYEGETLMEKLLAHREQPIPALGGSEQVAAVFRKMVAKTIDDRYQSMREVVADLEACAAASASAMSGATATFASQGAQTDASVVPQPRESSPNQDNRVAAKANSAGKGAGKKWALVAAGLLGALIVAAAVVVKLRTTEGTLVVTIDQPDAVVEILNDKNEVEITRPGEQGKISIGVSPGQHRLRVKKDGFEFFAQDFSIESGGKVPIQATLVPDKPAKPDTTGNPDPKDSAPQSTAGDRAIAEWVHSKGGGVGILLQDATTGGKKIWVPTSGALPEGPFHVTGCAFSGETNQYQVTDADLEKFKGLSHLDDLSLPNSAITDAGLKDLKHLSELVTLVLSGTRISDEGLKSVAKMKNLHYLTLQSMNQISDRGLQELKALPHLYQLSLERSPVSTAPLVEIPSLRDLWIDAKQALGLPDLGQLDSLTISGPNDACVAHLGQLKLERLKAIGMRYSEQVSQASRAALAEALPECDINWDGVHFMVALPSATLGPPIKTLSKPDFQKWMRDVAALPAEEQVKAVVKKMQELNPGFDGQETHKSDANAVTELRFDSYQVRDVSPVRALTSLKSLYCPTDRRRTASTLADLSPLKGLPLETLYCHRTNVTDLSALKQMPLQVLAFDNTKVTDFSPLRNMPIKAIGVDGVFKPERDSDILRSMTSLTTINGDTPSVFWKQVEKQTGVKTGKSWESPEFTQWSREVGKLPGEQQVAAVVEKLQELNPDFDGKEHHVIKDGEVTGFAIATDNVTNISPVSALVALKDLKCNGGKNRGKLSDLSPLKELKLAALECAFNEVSDLSPLRDVPLTTLTCHDTKVSDLSPLEQMPLQSLSIGNTPVVDLTPLKGLALTFLRCPVTQISDLTPLKGMPLIDLNCGYMGRLSDLGPLAGMPLQTFSCDGTSVSDLSSLRGMPLTVLHCNSTKVSDLSPLEGMQLTKICFTPKNVARGIDTLREMKSLKTIALGWDREQLSPDAFWKKYDAGEFAAVE